MVKKTLFFFNFLLKLLSQEVSGYRKINYLRILETIISPASLQIICVYKQVICQAKHKF